MHKCDEHVLDCQSQSETILKSRCTNQPLAVHCMPTALLQRNQESTGFSCMCIVPLARWLQTIHTSKTGHVCVHSTMATVHACTTQRTRNTTENAFLRNCSLSWKVYYDPSHATNTLLLFTASTDCQTVQSTREQLHGERTCGHWCKLRMPIALQTVSQSTVTHCCNKRCT